MRFLTHLRRALLVALLGVLGCRGTPVAGPAGDDASTPSPPLVLEKIAQVPTSYRSEGLAITPDFEYVVTAGLHDGITVHRATDYAVLGRVGDGTAQTLTMRPDRLSILTGSRNGTREFTIPDLQRISQSSWRCRSDRLVSDSRGDHYYGVVACDGPPEVNGMLKFDADGELVGAISQPENGRHSIVAMTPDDRRFLALDDSPGTDFDLVVADAASMEVERRIDLGYYINAIVPLLDSRHALLVSGVGNHVDGYIRGVVVDLESGAKELPQRIEGRPNTAPRLPEGTSWTYLPGELAVVGTRQGIVVVDALTGTFLDILTDVPAERAAFECCSVAYDAARDRLLVAGNVQTEERVEDPFLTAWRIVR